MKVTNLQPFEVVYTLAEHAHLGLLIEPHAVQINSLGNYTLTHQKVYNTTIDYFEKNTDDTDRKLVNLLGELDQEVIVKKFHAQAAIRPAEFFKKHFNEELYKKFIRPYIEKRLADAIELLRGKKLFQQGKEGNPTARRVNVAEQKSTVLFHFRRDDDKVRYFPTIRYNGERIEFSQMDGVMVTTTPAWLLVNGMLYNFEKNVDGNKLLPFLNKRFIMIPKATEAKYFEKFVVPLVEKFDVNAVGFDIKTESLQGSPVLKIDNAWGDEVRLNLYFRYGKQEFPYHATKKVSVILEKEGDNYIFKRLRRSKEWEDQIKDFLVQKGLSLIEGCSLAVRANGEKAGNYATIQWLNENIYSLESRRFIIEQDTHTGRYFIGQSSLSIQVNEYKDWFDVRAVVRFGKFEIPFLQLRSHILQGKREFLLPSGEIAVIPEEWFTKYSSLLEFNIAGDEIRVKKHHWKLLDELQNGSTKDEIKEKLSHLNFESLKEITPLSPHFTGELRPYQMEGYSWFYFLKRNSFGGCLADDMGLGKTVQTLALLQREADMPSATEQDQPTAATSILQDVPRQRQAVINQLNLFAMDAVAEQPAQIASARRRTNLIILPTSLIYNWLSEANRFAPHLKIFIYTGTYRNRNIEYFSQYDLVMTTYGVARMDIDILKEFKFHYVILDESQYIKNPASQTARAVNDLQSAYRLVLTGTPVENSIVDLWSQMNFLNPGLLGNFTFFNEKFVTPIEKNGDEIQRARLQKIIDPFILRRTKEQVAKDLPEKYDQVYYCEMTEEQERVYESTKSLYRNQILKSVSEFGLNKSKLQILKGLMMLRQIANHPLLVQEDYLGTSGKFDEINRKLSIALAEGHKVLLFSQFVKQLSIFEKHLTESGIDYCYIDGSLSSKQRQYEVEKFQQEKKSGVFLISLRAGGIGLNLTEADYVFIVDPWWNPAVERQATDRSYRIGQTKNVFNYKFITRNTVEEKILTLQKKKLALAETLITSDNTFLSTLSMDEIENIFV
ncbi:MAG TPA: DEAD/DEAH box helicase [Bacteroidia bacterium]|nr:DEAD/DEAH box helicase [Bacteroidia bacterium]